MTKNILYIGWVGFGNQGDDLCYEIFANRVSRKAQEQGLEVNIDGIYPANFNEFTLARKAPDLVVLGAGSLFEPVYLKPLVLASQNSINTAIWGSGYDSMLESPIQASGINPDSAFMIRQVVQNAPLLGVRGPYTMEMLKVIGASNPRLDIVGDPGFLLDQWDSPAPLPELDHIQSPIVAVNWGTASHKVLGGDEKPVARDLRDALSSLGKSMAIVIYPVWSRDIPACTNLYQELNHPNCVLLDRVPSMGELITLYTRSVFSVNMKLHANVFSAALDCPFLCLAYRMKGWDFASSLGWTHFTILFSDPDRKEKMLRGLDELQRDWESPKTLLQERRKQLQSRVSSLTDGLLALLK